MNDLFRTFAPAPVSSPPSARAPATDPVYLDHAASTPMLGEAVAAMTEHRG